MGTKNRNNGSGSIIEEKNGTYTAVLRYVSPADGHLHAKKKRGCKTEAEANRAIKAWNKEINSKDFVDVRRDTVEDFMTDWLEVFKKPDLKPTSYDRLEMTLKLHIFPKLGKVQMGKIDAETIQKHLNSMQTAGKSYSTIKKVYDAFNACFKWGISSRKLQYNPMGAVIVPGSTKKKSTSTKKSRKSSVKFFTPEQQDKLIAAAIAKYPNGTPIYRFGYVVPLLLNTGMRLGELLGLQWKRDVDLDQRTISIDNSLVLIKNRNVSTENKTVLLDQDSVKSESGVRTLYLNDEALDAIKHLYEITGSQTYVLSTKAGKPVQPSNIERMMRNVVERAGLPANKNMGPHALRHSFATNLFRQHVDVKVISELLGHSDVGVTSNIYMHVMDDQRRDALVKIASRTGDTTDKKEGAT